MNFLIDGHNLIGKLPDIQLSDPDDEAKLILKLINWSAVGKNRRVVVVFDGGVPGNHWSAFRSERVKTVFVPQGKTADSWLIRFMRTQVRNPQAFTLISSDNEIIKAARAKRIPFIKSDLFAAQMSDDIEAMFRLEAASDERAPEPAPIPTQEVDNWLSMFGGERDVTINPYKPKPKPAPKPEAAETKKQTTPDADDFMLNSDEVSDWLALFGGEPEEKVTKPSRPTPSTTKKQPKPPREKPADPRISQDDTDLWLSLFGGE